MPIRSAVPAESRHQDGPDRRAPDFRLADTPPSVLHVIAPGAIGGAESVVRLLAVAQRERGSRVAVAAIVPEGDDAPFVEALRDASIPVHVLNVPWRAYALERGMVERVCSLVSPSVVHTHGYRADVIDGLHVRRRGVPTVSTVHGFTGGDLRNRAYQWLQRRAYRTFHAIAVVSSPLREQLASVIHPERLHVVPNAYRPAGVTLSRNAARSALRLPQDAFILGWVGRLSREKGADVLLDAMAHLAVPECVHAAIIGDGPEHDIIERQLSRLKLKQRVTLLGRVAHADRYTCAFDAFVLSSRTEGTPMVVLEAMAAGVPIIATHVGGVPDVLPPGTALLVPRESPDRLAAAIRNVFVERGAAAARAHAAFTRLVTAYGVAEWAERYESIYQRACAIAARSGA